MCEIRKKVLLPAITVFVGILFLLTEETLVRAEEFSQPLFAKSAVLMDGSSGRVLYGKDAEVQLPMASTTKVMTCILALENCAPDEVVTVSKRAASQPDVKLNMREGETYYLKDLLYSLMLKSHNDSAVAIAEHIGGSVEAFGDMMNEKARDLNCMNTYFVTPNGLDAQDEGGVHSTTATDLAMIMRYAIKNDTFLAFTQTKEHSFTDIKGSRQFVVYNTNALLGTMEGLIAGKTGFTGDAGYCYVCAVQRDDRIFIVALLACGWPNNKTYKWQDTQKLIDYAFSNYYYRNVWQEKSYSAIPVKDGIPVSQNLYETAYVNVALGEEEKHRLNLLLREDEEVQVEEKIKESLTAPAREGEIVGAISYKLYGKTVAEYPVLLTDSISRIDYSWCSKKIFGMFFLGK